MAYSQDVQDILSAYATGDMNASQVRRALKKKGYAADLREAPRGEVQVFPIDLGPDKEASGEYYAFAGGGAVPPRKFKNGGAVLSGRGGKFKGVR